MSKPFHVRQGDVLLRKVEELPEGDGAAKLRQVPPVLALGEVTGHKHVVQGEGAVAYAEKGQELAEWVVVPEGGATVVHEEHGAIVLDPGVYQVTRQREYAEQDEPRWVAD